MVVFFVFFGPDIESIRSEIKLIMPCPIFYKSPSILLVGAGPTSSALIQAAAVHVATVVAADEIGRAHV